MERVMFTRRQWFTHSSAALVTCGLVSTMNRRRAKPVLRAAHITDVHITEGRESPIGVQTMFQHMFGELWAPQLVINTGDTVMGIDGAVTGARAKAQIELWRRATADCKAPIFSCLGNHDVWDGREPTAEIPADKAGFGLMTEVLNMPHSYYSFDQGGWHFIALNSVIEWPKYGRLTEEHFQWLIDDLKKTPADVPVCVFSHLPILSVTSSVYGDSCRKDRDVVIPGIWQHFDCWAISEIFRQFPNVKLCLSGHMHTWDQCEYRGVWYVCGGAVSGAWWGGSEYGFPPCYGQIDLFEDGAFTYRFTDYQWKNRQWSGKKLDLLQAETRPK
jgi:Icc protein